MTESLPRRLPDRTHIPDTSAVTVLLVEDDEVIRRSVALALEATGSPRPPTGSTGWSASGMTTPTCCFST
ncbi:hypothetical protein GA0115245_110027 [Streptomyces sp. di188]|nr:hypothetical protein GA0115238_117326 [Streptomyces sp. di50b]SCD60833.1 hypothetical protein GA0115245_110027 [Streptomyces sp. di188]